MLGVKAAFVACNFLALGLGIWKVNGMGLLPLVALFALPPMLLLSVGVVLDMLADMLCEQNDEIRLAGVGDSERFDRDGLLRALVKQHRQEREFRMKLNVYMASTRMTLP